MHIKSSVLAAAFVAGSAAAFAGTYIPVFTTDGTPSASRSPLILQSGQTDFAWAGLTRYFGGNCTTPQGSPFVCVVPPPYDGVIRRMTAISNNPTGSGQTLDITVRDAGAGADLMTCRMSNQIICSATGWAAVTRATSQLEIKVVGSASAASGVLGVSIEFDTP